MKNSRIVFPAILCALFCVLSPITIPIGPVPMSLSTLVLGIIVLTMTLKDAVLIVLLYLLVGAMGLPVFSGFGSGIGHIIGPSGGFLIGYIPYVLSGSVIHKINPRRKLYDVIALIISTVTLYIFGSVYYMLSVNVTFKTSLIITILPFILPEIGKIFISVFISNKIHRKLSSF